MKTIQTQVPAIDKATRIFQFLANHEGATYSQIYQGLALPQSSTSTLLNSLVTNGLLRQYDNKYYLGLNLYEFGNKAVEQFDIKTLAVGPLTYLRDKTNLTCHLGILEGDSACYLAKVESPSAIVIRSWLGKKLSLHSSGLGKVLLAWLPEAKLDSLLPDEVLEKKTEKTIVSKQNLIAELANVKVQGWAVDEGEDYDDISCLAVPVFDAKGQVIAAISMTGVSIQLAEGKKLSHIHYLQEAAAQLSALMR